MGMKITRGDVKGIIVGIVAIGLIVASLYFFLNSMTLITINPPNVTASLLAALIGFSLLSAGVTVLKSWALARAAEKVLSEEAK